MKPEDYVWFRDQGQREEGVGMIALRARQRQYEIRDALVELKQERETLHVMVDNLPVGVLFAKHTGEIVLANRSVERILRLSPLPSSNIEAYDRWIAFHADGNPVREEEYPLRQAKRLKHLELDIRECVRLVRVDAKNAGHHTGDLERNTDLGACVGFAGDIVRVLVDVAGVVHLARGCHVADYALPPDLQPVALLARCTAPHTPQDYLVCIACTEPYRGLHTSN